MNASCTDIPGSYKCDCVLGYEGNGTLCESMVKCFICDAFMMMVYILDVDECENVTLNNCDDNADCFDTEGSFTCTCREGYTGSGMVCQGMYWTVYHNYS